MKWKCWASPYFNPFLSVSGENKDKFYSSINVQVSMVHRSAALIWIMSAFLFSSHFPLFITLLQRSLCLICPSSTFFLSNCNVCSFALEVYLCVYLSIGWSLWGHAGGVLFFVSELYSLSLMFMLNCFTWCIFILFKIVELIWSSMWLSQLLSTR